MKFYRYLKAALYNLIPSSFLSQDTAEFNTASDLVAIYKDLPEVDVYQTRGVTIDQLKSMVGGGEGYELTFYASGAGATEPAESPTFINIGVNTFPNSNFIITFDPTNDGLKIQDDNENDYFSVLENTTLSYLNAYFFGFTAPYDDQSDRCPISVIYIGPNTISVKAALGAGSMSYFFDYLSCTIKIFKV